MYPCSRTSSSSTVPLPLSAEVLAVLLEVSAGYSTIAFCKRFLKPAPASKLGRFSVVDAPVSTTAGVLATDGATDPLLAPPSDFILSRLNISAQQKKPKKSLILGRGENDRGNSGPLLGPDDMAQDKLLIKGHPRGNFRGGCLVPIPKKEKAPTSERGTPDYTPMGNANLAIGGIFPGTHHPGKDLSLQEQLHRDGKKTCIKATTRTKHSNAPSPDSTSR
ncbi:hypothetical protein B296_00003402 [Ensete ventricosum]|uniref:Uncharacterized protein n=1 Tax=Ensete ventricosum TaxID=4639 RepID=A0A427B4V8_ENSVE|nr:hypothetical protein B296_00003402 [Ensete ventricosum]